MSAERDRDFEMLLGETAERHDLKRDPFAAALEAEASEEAACEDVSFGSFLERLPAPVGEPR